MRILQVNSAQTIGGAETHVRQLTRKLRELGHDARVAGRSNSPLRPDFNLPFRNSADFLSALRLRQILRSEKFDIVHAHIARDYPVVAAAAFRISDLAVVFTRHLLYPVKQNPFYRRVDGWIAPTAEIATSLKALRPQRLVVVPNWVDPEEISFSPHPLHTPIQIGALGQIAAHKGPEDLLEALRLLGPGFRLSLAGEGNADYVNKLRDLARDLPVEFIGFTSPAEFFQKIDILIQPSWHEPFGITILEAMAAGIPVIATDSGGPLELISSGEQGLLVPAKEPVSLAQAIQQMANSSALRLRIIENARGRVEKEFNIEQRVSEIANFYRICQRTERFL